MSRIDEINAILDDLGDTPNDAELEYRLRDYATRELLEVVADRAAGGGGGSSGVAIAKVTITDAQIKTLVATPVEVVPAPGAGKAVDLLRVFLSARIVETGREYTNIGPNATIKFLRDNAEIGPLLTDGTYFGVDTFTELLGTYSDIGIGGNTIVAGPWYDIGDPDKGAMPVLEQRGDSVDNKPIVIKLGNAPNGELTGGHAANALVVSTVYATFDIA